MKKIFTVLAIFCGIVSYSYGQYYFNAFLSAGTNPGGLNTDSEFPNNQGLPAGWSPLIGPSVTTPAWSASQSIPFTFNFNASPVTQYKVSSTGVLTFTTTATAVPSATSSALPSASIPDNSVCVWGIQANGGNDYVMSKTFGTAPNRQHWVFFTSHSLGGGGWSYWSIVMEEGSDNIYIVDQRHSGTSGGVSMGIQVNSTTAYSVGANVLPTAGTDPTAADNSYYEFIQGTRPANDIELLSLNFGNSVPANSTTTIAGMLKNAGADTLQSYTLVWSPDGGTTLNSQVITASIPPLTTTSFSHPTTWTPVGGVYNLQVYTAMPNGMADANAFNDTINQAVAASSGASVSKNPLLEEFTTAPCQFCPDGAVVVENILNSNPSVIGVGVHACFGTDAMTIPEAVTYCNAFGSGAPTACVDRVLFPGETNVAFSRANNQWLNRANSQSNLGSPVDVTVTGTYNPNNATGNIDVTANFVDYVAGDLRVTLFVVEDHVRGVGSGYDQVNFYNTQAGHPYAGAGNPIVNYDHRHVLRDVYPTTDAWGDATVIPQTPMLNTNYTMSSTITVDPAWNADSMTVIGFVNYFNSDVGERQVLNAFEVKLGNLVTSIDELTVEANSLSIYPNPTNSITNLEFMLGNASNVQLDLFDLTGKKVRSQNYGTLAQGRQVLQINVEELNQGFYFVNLNVDGNIVTKKISVIK